MSILQVNSLQSNILNLDTQLTVGNVTLNTTAISTGGINITGNTTLSSITVNGTSYSTLNTSFEYVNTQIFTSSGTWTKPSWATNGSELVLVNMWGGGGAGNTGTGGGGGAFVFGYYMANQLSSTVSVSVGSGGTTSASQTVRYVRWVITGVRSSGSGTQAAEFVLQNAGVDISMTGTTVTSSESGSPGNQLPAQLVDGNLATKFYTGNNPTITLTFDLGSAKTFTGYRWATAEDVIERDPISWRIETSSDNVNWTVVDIQINFNTSTSRNVYIGPFTFPSGQPSVFANLVAYGGGGANSTVAGGGGGWFSAGLTGNGGGPLGNTTVGGTSTFGGGAGGNTTTSNVGGVSVYGGAGGGGSGGAGGYTVFGGGGGTATGAVGISIYGGFGGNSTVSASAPGGGGANAASGARGEVRVYTYRIAP